MSIMLRALALLSAFLFSSLAQDPEILARFGSFERLSSPPNLYELYWRLEGETKSTIRFLVRVQTEGWVGFGISPSGLMPDSDVVMGFIDDTTGAADLTVGARA